jgi:predicted nucleic acid-binding protein
LSTPVQALLSTLETPFISDWVRTEFSSALALRVRSGVALKNVAKTILARFQAHVDEGVYEVLPVLSRDYELAYTWISRFDTTLRAPDALHLAVAYNNACLLLTADVKMAASAQGLGVKVRLVQ